MHAILQHLRFPFSLLLFPVFLMAVYAADWPEVFPWFQVVLLGIVLHLFIYPSSNAYNSLQDRDTGSIGLVKHPKKAPQELQLLTIILDLFALVISFIFLPFEVSVCLCIYILASRLYSWRKIRIKKYPIAGFLIVFSCQGGLIFFLTTRLFASNPSILLCVASSALIGAIYPLSQIYQHTQDRADGVTSISMLLGYRGTFLFSAALFILGTLCFCFHFMVIDPWSVLTFSICLFPSTVYFFFWAWDVWKSTAAANYQRSMRMSILSAIGMNLCFIFLILFRFGGVLNRFWEF